MEVSLELRAPAGLESWVTNAWTWRLWFSDGYWKVWGIL